MSTLEVNTINPQSGTTITIGGSGDTVTLGSGATQSGFGGTNTPAFLVTKTSNQNLSDAVITKVTFDNVVFDTNSDVDIVTNNRFTPSVAGKYYIYASIGLYSGASSNYRTGTYRIRKNGSDLVFNQFNPESNFSRRLIQHIGITAEANGTTDYFEVFGQVDVTSGTPFVNGTASSTYFGGYRIIE